MAGFFCITRISGTSHKIGRNFSQDLPHLVTRYQASRFLASFYVLFCGHIPLPVGNMPLPKNCPKNPSEVSASPQTACSWAFRLKDWLLKFFSRVFILSAGIYVFSAMAVYFPASSEFSPCTCVLFTFRPLGTLVSVSAILSCRPFFILIFLPYIKMRHYGFSRKSIWKNLETFP